jgi:hypothetical protein
MSVEDTIALAKAMLRRNLFAWGPSGTPTAFGLPCRERRRKPLNAAANRRGNAQIVISSQLAFDST